MLNAAPTLSCDTPAALYRRTTPARRQPMRSSSACLQPPAGPLHHAMRAGAALLAALCITALPGVAAETSAAQSGAADHGIQQSGCGITMSCAPDSAQDGPSAPEPPAAGQCVSNNAGNPCGSASGPASQGSTTGQDVGAGNPIDVLSGNKYQQEVDLPALPGILGLEIVRHYNSRRARPGDIGALGSGWRLSYETRLNIRDDRLEILQADGARVIFARRPGEPQRCASRDPSRGEILLRHRPGGGDEYLWRWPDGRSLLFDSAGHLVQILVASGEFVSLRHDAAGRLLQVTDPQGRSLQVHYHAPGSGIDGITHIDSPLGRFSYAQERVALPARTDAGTQPGRSVHAPQRPGSAGPSRPLQRGAPAGKAAAPAVTAARLLRVDYPGAPAAQTGGAAAREYHYEDPRHPVALTGISVLARQPAGPPVPERIASYAYDHAGRGIRSVRGALPAGGESGPEDVRLDYPERGRSVLTNSLGQRTTYLGAVIAGQRRLLEARGPGCARCGPTDVRYRYTPDGRLSAITTLDAEGRPRLSTQHRFDTRGRLAETLGADLSGARPRLLDRTRYEYPDAPATALADTDRAAQRTEPAATTPPRAIIRPSVVPGREHRIELRYNATGQPIELRESGFSPIDAEGRPDPVPIERRVTWRYATINGRSVLAELDGPLPDGADASPLDSDLVRLHWDERGSFIRALEGPGGQRSEIESDPATGLPRRVRDAEGHETHLRHDSAGQLIRWRSRSAGEAADRIHAAEYDALGQLVELRSGEDEERLHPRWRRAFDAAGRLQWHADALGILRTWAYDHESRVVETGLRSASRLLRRRWRYDEHGRLAAIDDDTGFTRSLRHDVAGRIVGLLDSHGRELLPPARHPDGGSAPAAPPAHPRILKDDFGRPVLERSPDAGARWRSFDAAGRLVAMGDALGHRARYTWDPRGRILAQEITDGRNGSTETTRWRYDGSRLLEVDHPNGRERYEYDQRGLRSARIVSLKRDGGELVVVTRYEYDAEGHLVATTLPDGSRLRYERNGQGQVVALKRQPVATPWLRALAREQVIASGFERDLFGLRGFRAGNGMRTLHERTRTGTLVRVVHLRADERGAPVRNARALLPIAPGQPLAARIERLFGISAAHAAQANTDADVTQPVEAADGQALEGALPRLQETVASADTILLDYQYVWDPEGNLLHARRREPDGPLPSTRRSQAYDLRNQLVASVEWRDDGDVLAETAVWRYAYDRHQRRVLAQEGAVSQQELAGHTRPTHFAPGSHRALSSSPRAANVPARAAASRPHEAATPGHHDASGQPERFGARSLRWDALGRLIEVRAGERSIARYAYDHRGLRIARTRFDPAMVAPTTTHTVYDDARQPLAELDADGRLIRQYLWLADLPLAVLDTPARPDSATDSARRILADLGRIAQSWLAPQAGLAWLHTNHLGAPELATDADGEPLWRARHAPFGAATVTTSPRRPDFTLDLRLPGQVFDAETGLHYNRRRYYAPTLGEYLTPDPLGTPDGPNPYAYAAFNPLRNVDPDGLVLFAFDGTGNSDDLNDPAMAGSGFSNVVYFARAYNDGNRRYISGVGTVHHDIDYGDIRPEDHATGHLLWWLTPGDPVHVNDMGGNYSGPARIGRMSQYLDDEAELFSDDRVMDIDIVGFSRGAAQAREFANRIVAKTVRHEGQDYYRYTNRRGDSACQAVDFRFMGLFDTVLSTNFSGEAYRLGIPEVFAHVAQAVALNEHRSDSITEFAYRNPKPHRMHWGGFPLESIGASSAAPGRIRIEKGFVGAHADIGGGYPDAEQGLSLVALNWMVAQARDAGVEMESVDPVPILNVVIHDQSNVIEIGNPQHSVVPRPTGNGDLPRIDYVFPEDRAVNGAVAGDRQRRMAFDNGSLTHADTLRYITWLPRDATRRGDGSALDPRRLGDVTGTVDMASYLAWLGQPENGYTTTNGGF